VVLDELINTTVRRVDQANKETEAYARRSIGSTVMIRCTVWSHVDGCELLSRPVLQIHMLAQKRFARSSRLEVQVRYCMVLS
jgi:dTDP-4-dehydrorhamnose reductase